MVGQIHVQRRPMSKSQWKIESIRLAVWSFLRLQSSQLCHASLPFIRHIWMNLTTFEISSSFRGKLMKRRACTNTKGNIKKTENFYKQIIKRGPSSSPYKSVCVFVWRYTVFPNWSNCSQAKSGPHSRGRNWIFKRNRLLCTELQDLGICQETILTFPQSKSMKMPWHHNFKLIFVFLSFVFWLFSSPFQQLCIVSSSEFHGQAGPHMLHCGTSTPVFSFSPAGPIFVRYIWNSEENWRSACELWKCEDENDLEAAQFAASSGQLMFIVQLIA